MIHAKDLRIGNWVQDDHFRFGVVKSISDHSIRIKMEHSTLKRDSNHDFNGLDIEPITLTPEIITKCDFAKCYESTWLITFEKLNNGLFEIQFLKKYKAVALFKGEKLRDIEYLHQLQNLFFAIYSEELGIQL
jgi:hypothetical protein